MAQLLLLLLTTVVFALHLQDARISSTVKDVLNSACPNMPVVYITNPLAPNWIYGGMHPAQYNNLVEGLR